MPCPLHASLTPRKEGEGDISHNDPCPKSSPSESHPFAHLYHSKAADGGSQIPKAKSHIPSRRRQRHERLRGKPVAKRETQQFQGILSSRVPHPHPWHDHPRSPFMFVGHSSDLLRAVPFKPPRLSHRGEPTNEGRSPYQHALFCSFARSFTMSPSCPQNWVWCPRNSRGGARPGYHAWRPPK